MWLPSAELRGEGNSWSSPVSQDLHHRAGAGLPAAADSSLCSPRRYQAPCSHIVRCFPSSDHVYFIFFIKKKNDAGLPPSLGAAEFGKDCLSVHQVVSSERSCSEELTRKEIRAAAAFVYFFVPESPASYL